MTEPLAVDQRVARMVVAASLSTLVAMLLVTGATLSGDGRSGDLLGDAVMLVVVAAGSIGQRQSPAAVRAAAALAMLGAIAAAAALGVFVGYQGPDPGVAVFAWTRMLVALVAGIAALSTLWGVRRAGPATASGLWALAVGYWLSCVAVGYLA